MTAGLLAECFASRAVAAPRVAPARGLMVAPHVTTVPGLVIMLAGLGINLLDDGLRDALDPRLRGA